MAHAEHHFRELSQPNEGEEALAAGDLGSSDACSRFLDKMHQEEYYNSIRFAIGYQELQDRWTSSLENLKQEPFPSAGGDRRPSLQRSSLVLPLQEYSLTHRSNVSAAQRRHRRWGTSSTSPSPLGTPSPLLSAAPSPIPSCSPTPSIASSERGDAPSGIDSDQSSTSSMCECGMSGRCCRSRERIDENGTRRRGTNNSNSNSSSSSSRRTAGGLLEAVRRAIRNLRGQREGPSSPKSSTENQFTEMEAELESYKALSESKRRAADLLKHQLMEVLYEKVVMEVEEKHKRRRLEEEIMSLEFQMHLLRSTTEDNLRYLNCQLQRIIAEKKVLQRQLKTRTLPDDSSLTETGASSLTKTNDLGLSFKKRRSL